MNPSLLEAYESEFSEFLIQRIVNAGGSLQLQHISGHLSQVRNDIRNAIGRSQLDLLQFIKKHKNIFIIKGNKVSLVDEPTFSNSGYDSDDNSIRSHSSLPALIKNGKGVIVKVFPGYGFIRTKEPIKTDIFFKSLCFGDRNIDLTSFLHVGAVVFFNAKRKSSSERNCKYDAIKVWRLDDGVKDNVIIQKTQKSRDTGLYDPLNLESEGIIQTIFPNLGFISVKGDNNNTVFFHKNRVVNYDNIVDLTKVFCKGDRVEFTAHRSSKPDAKARWEATKVWKVAGNIEQDESQSVSCSQISLPKEPISNLGIKSHEMIKNRRGKIYPRSHGAVIKFGNNELADGDSALYYVCGTQVTEIGWEFTEGDEIYFDAVKIKSSPGWKAVLVWTDTKPDVVLPTCLGDFSEFSEEEENEEISSSIYESKSSLCMSKSSNSSVKSQKCFSKSKDLKAERAQKLPDSFLNKEIEDRRKALSKDYYTSSRDSLDSLPVSEKYCFAGKKNSDAKKLSKDHNSSFRDSLSSLPVSDNYYFAGKENSDSNKKLSKNFRGSLNSLPASDSYCFVGKENNDTPKKLSKNRSISSKESLSPVRDKYNLRSCEKIVKSSPKVSIDQLNKVVLSNWGDSPFPVDEAYESMEGSKSVKSDFSLKNDRKTKHFTDDEIENSSEYASDEEEMLDKTTNIMKRNDDVLSKNISSKCAASIKRYPNIKGEIKKVFSRFAEIKSCNLQNSISFSMNDFCLNGKFADELEPNDLKHILKVGDHISFNCFVIIDDSGQIWQKVTLAWKGSKPKFSDEISPEDFIKQNNLSVTINNETNFGETTDKAIRRKFLTSFIDEVSENVNNLSKTDSYSDEESLPSRPKSQAHSKAELPIDFENLSDTVYKILKRDMFSNNSTVDIKSLSEEIINIVQNGTKKTTALTYNVLSEASSYVTNPLENVCSKCKEQNLSSRSTFAKISNTGTQTIITGEIISQSVLPFC